MTTAYDFSFRDLEGQPQALAQYQGRPLLLVNVASRCGFTPQYTGLSLIHISEPTRQEAISYAVFCL